jgi:hypothetical protein
VLLWYQSTGTLRKAVRGEAWSRPKWRVLEWSEKNRQHRVRDLARRHTGVTGVIEYDLRVFGWIRAAGDCDLVAVTATGATAAERGHGWGLQ